MRINLFPRFFQQSPEKFVIPTINKEFLRCGSIILNQYVMAIRIKHSESLRRVRRAAEKIVFCDGKHCRRIPVHTILYCEACKLGTMLYFAEKDFILSSKNIGYWEKKLPRFFWRIHDHWLVNSDEIEDLVFSERYLLIRSIHLDIARRRLHTILEKFKHSGIQ